ncbi:MAG: serine/threonine-protein kinase, partial [Planctomycetota bacterium]
MLAPGTRIGGLLIGDMLGRGAMGEVYRGVQLSLRRPVAVKRIAGHLLDDEGAVQRFAREAQCVARVQSPHVVTVYEFGRYPAPDGDEHLLLVMELVDGGRSLGELIDGPLPWRLVCGAIQQVVEGLCAAAEHGVVHRDIKPDNIMLAPKGVAKLCDFGLARSVDSTAMTAAGSLLGTPNYMPPEACRGDEVDHAGDIYALGGTWFHLLAGRPPFGGGSTMALLRAHIEDPAPDLHAIDPGIPQAVARLVAQCLGKDPVFRPTAAQLRDELHAASREGLHLPRLVPELLGDAAGAERDPSTTMTVIAQDPTLSLILAEDYDPEAETLPTGRAARAARGAGRRTRTVAVLLPLLVAAGAGGDTAEEMVEVL